MDPITKTSGPCLIMAGAGTGKTSRIVDKICYLVENKVYKPSEILCLTFSNEATNHLKVKVQEKIQHSADITIRTFHGFCAEVLREFGHLVGVDPGFEILLPDDAKVIFHRYLDVTPYYANRYEHTIASAKDLGISFQDITKHTEKLAQQFKEIHDLETHAQGLDLELKTLHLRPNETAEEKKAVRDRKKEIATFLANYKDYTKYREFTQAWAKYEEYKHKHGFLDYADLNVKVLELLNLHGNTALASRYKYVIIDEFQDTNKLQFELIEHLAGGHRNITVVGDQNQSVYGFRGAHRESFNHFKQAFRVNDETDIQPLTKSHRSPNTILRIASNLIKNNYENPEECLVLENAKGVEGDKVTVVELKNGDEEARKVAELVEEELHKGTPLSEVCVLYRTHHQGKLIRQALEAKNVPIISAGKTDLLQRPEIRTVIAYLSIINNLRERTGTGEQAWWDLFHYHNALTPQDSVIIGRYLKSKRDDSVSIDQGCLNHLEKIGISAHGKKVLHRIIERLEILTASTNKAIPDLILDIYDLVGLNRAFTHTRSIRNVEALMNLKQFYDVAEGYTRKHDGHLSSFIGHLEILDDLGVSIPASTVQDVNAVRLMTIHAAKGLEFATVIVTNLADGRFPVERTRNEPLIPKELLPDLKRYIESLGALDDSARDDAIKDYERSLLLYEERRLCYVAFTRAKSRLIVTYARSYNDEEDSASPSVFLTEVAFSTNPDIVTVKDDEEKCTIFAPCSRFEQYKSLLKNQLVSALDTDDFPTLLSRLVTYHAVREGEIQDYARTDWKQVIDARELQTHIAAHHEKKSLLKFDAQSFTFSPTALLVYDDCPKKYELAHIFQMPERGAFSWSGASTGSFVHQLLEDGVRDGYATKQEFVDHAVELSKLADWDGVDLKDVNALIDVFWERHQGRYNSKTLVEEWLNLTLDGFRFVGKADRIDVLHDKDVEIIDYKTDKNPIEPRKRAWQLGFYLLAARQQLKLNPVKITLEMLRQEKPYEAAVDADGNVTSGRSKGFNVQEVELELVECARKIVHDYETEFLPTTDDSNCRYCGYKFYCPKWAGG